jgi:DeoR/GlpR family transcriptional regulator of sugar metabolism
MHETSTNEHLRPRQRRELILTEVLAGDGRVTDLSLRFGVSEATIRRDLHRLKLEGRVARTYGGAISNPHAVESSLDQKELHNFREKDAIARAALAYIGDGDVVILDAGTTTGRLAWYLRERSDLTVITNAVNVLLTLSLAGGPDVVLLGGGLRRINQALLGGLAESNLRRLRADRVFLGAEGFSAYWGISCPGMSQSHLKQLMIAQAGDAIVLADHSKLGRAPFAHCTELDRPYTLITDSGATAAQLGEFRESTLATVVVAELFGREVAHG